MKRNLLFIFLAGMLVFAPKLPAQNNSAGFSDIQQELENILANLSRNIDVLESIQQKMGESAKANENYNQQKNIFLSSTLAIATISAICEYERDLLTLFIDLREKNRNKFFDVRIESLETSARQVENMYRQIQINYTIFPANIFEAPLIRKERLSIESSITLLGRCRQLLISVNRK